MNIFIEWAKGESLYKTTCGLLFFGLILLGLRMRFSTSGSDVSIIILNICLGLEF